jgi:uncharacterized membrane protein YebE (DUF533 family)
MFMGSRRGLGGAIRGGMGCGTVAMLGLIAWQAFMKNGSFPGQASPPAWREPRTDAERSQLERCSELFLKAMVNAAKADGRVDESEMSSIIGKVQEAGADSSDLDVLRSEIARPMDTDSFVAVVRCTPELAAQRYAASLLAILRVETPLMNASQTTWIRAFSLRSRATNLNGM